MAFHQPPLQAVQQATPALKRLRNLACRVVDEGKLLEVAAPGDCDSCGKSGYFNYMRIQTPAFFKPEIAGPQGQMRLEAGSLEPRLISSGPDGKMYCPACHLAYLDPLNFSPEIVS